MVVVGFLEIKQLVAIFASTRIQMGEGRGGWSAVEEDRIGHMGVWMGNICERYEEEKGTTPTRG